MPKKPDIAATLSAQLTQALEEQRARGGDSYPTTLRRLRDLANPSAPDALVLKAVGKAPFKDRAIVAQKKSLDAPASLRDDLERLAASPAVLDFALRALCTEASPTATPARLKMKLDPALRPAFLTALQHAIEHATLPPDVEWLPRANVLHPRWLPLPPEKKKPEIVLAEELVGVLEAQQRRGGSSYPSRLSALVALLRAPARATILNKARKSAPFVNRVVVLADRSGDPFLALGDDLTEAAGSPILLLWALQANRSGAARGFTVAELKSRIESSVRNPFAAAVEQRLRTGALPPGVGALVVRKGWVVFRLEDVIATAAPRSNPIPAAAVEPAVPRDFGAEFDHAFERLDRAEGRTNFVSLVALRQSLSADRAAFDRGLRALREAGRYTLSAASDGRGLTSDEQQAGIREEGALLLFVSRRA